jgi:hypothetical protein
MSSSEMSSRQTYSLIKKAYKNAGRNPITTASTIRLIQPIATGKTFYTFPILQGDTAQTYAEASLLNRADAFTATHVGIFIGGLTPAGLAATGANYSLTILTGNGSAAASSRSSSRNQGLFSWLTVSQTLGNTMATADFMNYSNTTTYKTILSRLATAATSTEAEVNLWRSTSAIDTIKIYTSGGNLLSGSTFTLYGIAAA